MRVAVIGSRQVPERIDEVILRYLPATTTEIVSGGAGGVDAAAECIARDLRIPIKIFLPDYETHGRRAPLLRNLDIIQYAEEVLAFWDGKSPGTRHVIATCIQCGKPVRLIPLSLIKETE